MPQMILGLLGLLAIIFLFIMVLAGIIVGLIAAGFGAITTLVISLIPISVTRENITFSRSGDRIDCTAWLAANQPSAWLRSFWVGFAAALPAMAHFSAPIPTGNFEHLLAYIGGVLGGIIGAIAVTTWGTEKVCAHPDREALPPVTCAPLQALRHQQQILNDMAVGQRPRDYLDEFDRLLGSQQWNANGQHVREIHDLAVRMLDAARRATDAARLDRELQEEYCTVREQLLSAHAAARIFAGRSDAYQVQEQWRRLRSLSNTPDYHPQTVRSAIAAMRQARDILIDFVRNHRQGRARPDRDHDAGGRDSRQGPGSQHRRETRAEVPDEVVRAFAVLQLTPSRNIEEIRHAYRYLRGIHHPDRGGPAASAERFQRIQQAWELIQRWLADTQS